MVHRGSRLLPFLIFIVTCLVTNPLFGGPTATLTGRVTDTIGGVIPGVKVQATNVETNVTFPGETNEEASTTFRTCRRGCIASSCRNLRSGLLSNPTSNCTFKM